MGYWLYSQRPTDGGMALVRNLKGRRIRKDGARFKPGKWRKIINWGNKEAPPAYLKSGMFINKPDVVALCIDKGDFFRVCKERNVQDSVVPFTTKIGEAQKWVDAGKLVVARTVLNGHSGRGIVLCSRKNNVALPKCPLYTLYVRKDEEYRVHLVRGKGGLVLPFYIQKKVKRPGFANPNRKVRCYDNGYTYQHDNVVLPDAVLDAAVKVFTALRLDFGAVDAIYCRDKNQGFVLEINTAPGLDGSSVTTYGDMFRKYF